VSNNKIICCCFSCFVCISCCFFELMFKVQFTYLSIHTKLKLWSHTMKSMKAF